MSNIGQQISELLYKFKSKYNLNSRLSFDLNCKKFSKNEYLDLYNKFAEYAEIINISQNIIIKKLNNNQYNYTKKQFMDGINKNEDIVYSENNIVNPIRISSKISEILDYTINLDKIINFTKEGNGNIEQIKLEIVNKFIIGSLPDWEFNINLNKCLNNQEELSLVVEYKNKLLVSHENLNFDFIDNICLSIIYIGQKQDINNLNLFKPIDYLFNLIDKDYLDKISYQKKIFEIAKYLIDDKITLSKFRNKLGFKSLTNNVVELNRPLYFNTICPNISNFFLTDKIDGQRGIIYIKEREDKYVIQILSDKLYTIQEDFIDYNRDDKITILDGEVLFNKDLSKSIIYIFDVMMLDGENISNKPFEYRYEYLDKIKKYKFLKIKEIIRLTNNYKKEIKDYYNKKRTYEIDGLIFTPTSNLSILNDFKKDIINTNYRNTISYKWKPVSHLSIDFYIKKIKDHQYILCNGISKHDFDKLKMVFCPDYINIMPKSIIENQYFPIQFSPDDDPYAYQYSSKEELDNKVGEFIYKNKKWEMIRLRTDRDVEIKRGLYFGNALKYSLLIWASIKNPLTFENLIDTTNEAYFAETSSNIYQAQRGFNSFIKTQMIELATSKTIADPNEKTWLLDLACGKGQDLGRIMKMQFKNIVMVDRDPDALYQLLERKFNLRVGRDDKASIYTREVDLTLEYKEILERLSILPLKKESVDIILINFALHYFTDTSNHIETIIKIVKYYLKPNGRFMFTCFDGNRIFELLKDNTQWDIRENDILKYSIIKNYKSNELVNVGQEIGVLLPFSNKQYYNEYLVNINYLTTLFKKYNINLELSESFEILINKFKDVNIKMYNQLTDNDKLFVSLYQMNIFKNGEITNKEIIKKIINL